MYHGLSLEEVSKYVYSLIKDVFPHIIEGKTEEEFVNSYSKALEKQVSGTECKEIEYLPNLFEYLEEFLRARDKIKHKMLELTEEDPEDQIFKKTGIREKDCHRMSILMSSAVEKTFFGPTALTQPYQQSYIDHATEYFSIMSEVGFKPFVYIRKRSDSSNGSLSRTADMTVFQNSLTKFGELLKNDPNRLFKYELPTLLLSRIMPKGANKPRMIEDQNGVTKVHDRDIKGDVVSKVSHLIDKYDLHSGQHRAVCNVSDIERSTQMITQQCIEAAKYVFFTMMRYKPGIMELYYNSGYKYVVCTDATKFDQSISELLMRNLYKEYSKAIKIFDLERFRDNKHITWYNNEKGYVYSLNHLVDNQIHDTLLNFEKKLENGKITESEYQEAKAYLEHLEELNFIGGVDSGNPHVSHDGKCNMVGSLYVMFKYYMGVNLTPIEFSRNFFEVDYDEYVAAMAAKGLSKRVVKLKGNKKGKVAICNSSDDNFLAAQEEWIADAYKDLIQYCLESEVRPFLLAEPDAEFLSQILIVEDGKVRQIGNPGRKMQSRLVGEYSGRKEDGSFKDMVGATADRDAELRSSKIGTKLLSILDEVWTEEFGMNHELYVKKHMSGVEVKSEVQDALAALRITPNYADKELERSPSKAYYRDDLVDDAHDETMQILFTNISPVQTYKLYEDLGELDYVCEKIGDFAKNLQDTIDHTLAAIQTGDCPKEFIELYDISGLKDLVKKAIKYSNIEDLRIEMTRLAEVDSISNVSVQDFELRDEDVQI